MVAAPYRVNNVRWAGTPARNAYVSTTAATRTGTKEQQKRHHVRGVQRAGNGGERGDRPDRQGDRDRVVDPHANSEEVRHQASSAGMNQDQVVRLRRLPGRGRPASALASANERREPLPGPDGVPRGIPQRGETCAPHYRVSAAWQRARESNAT